MAILRLKDLDASRETYRRTFRLHQIFRTERGAERFLAGRQFLVITIVFLIAQLTSFHEAPKFAVRCFGNALSVASVQQLLAGYVSRTRVHPIIAARRGEHPGERDGGQADQQLMREPTKSATFRYRLPSRREPVSAAPASWSGLGDM